MKALVVEDEQLARERLLDLLAELKPDLEVLGQEEGVSGTVRFLQKQPDLDILFMDIHLADGPCFRIFQEVEVQVPIIFTTAYDQYALQAFDTLSIDYLLKPIHAKDLSRALQKLDHFKAGTTPARPHLAQELSGLIEELHARKTYQQRFLVQSGQQFIPVQTDQVAYFFAEGKYVYLVSVTGKAYLIDQTLDQLDGDLLDPNTFFRINRKAILNIESIKLVQRHAGNRLRVFPQQASTLEMVVSRQRVEPFKKWMSR